MIGAAYTPPSEPIANNESDSPLSGPALPWVAKLPSSAAIVIASTVIVTARYEAVGVMSIGAVSDGGRLESRSTGGGAGGRSTVGSETSARAVPARPRLAKIIHAVRDMAPVEQ